MKKIRIISQNRSCIYLFFHLSNSHVLSTSVELDLRNIPCTSVFSKIRVTRLTVCIWEVLGHVHWKSKKNSKRIGLRVIFSLLWSGINHFEGTFGAEHCFTQWSQIKCYWFLGIPREISGVIFFIFFEILIFGSFMGLQKPPEIL